MPPSLQCFGTPAPGSQNFSHLKSIQLRHSFDALGSFTFPLTIDFDIDSNVVFVLFLSFFLCVSLFVLFFAGVSQGCEASGERV